MNHWFPTSSKAWHTSYTAVITNGTLYLIFITPLGFIHLILTTPLGHSPPNPFSTIRNIHIILYILSLRRDFQYKSLAPLNREVILRILLPQPKLPGSLTDLCYAPALPIEVEALRTWRVFWSSCRCSSSRLWYQLLGIEKSHVQLSIVRLVHYCPYWARRQSPHGFGFGLLPKRPRTNQGWTSIYIKKSWISPADTSASTSEIRSLTSWHIRYAPYHLNFVLSKWASQWASSSANEMLFGTRPIDTVLRNP